MAFTHTTTRTFARSGESRSTSVSVSADAEDCREIAVAADASAYEVNIAVDVSLLKSLYMEASSTLTMNVNSGAGQEIVLNGGDAIQWKSTDAGSNPLGDTDVTKLLITNTGAVATTLFIRILQDSTVA